jgi:RimJ/RimL family protein N-acetyltransferase
MHSGEASQRYAVLALEAKHVPEVTEIHMSSWASNEVSVILGKAFVARFYHTVAQSPAAFGYVCVVDHQVIAYATGFWDYDRFLADLLRGHWGFLLRAVIGTVLAGRLRLADLHQIRVAHHHQKRLTYPRYHQNGLALRNEYKHTPLGRQAVTAVIQRVLETFRQAGAPGCWGRTDTRNIPMRTYYLKLGFTEVNMPGCGNARYVFFEKRLP